MDTHRAERQAVIAAEVARHTGYLIRFTNTRVRDRALAEDVVQEAIVAALESLDSFDGRSTLRTWLTGILLHKIQDAFRRDARGERPLVEGELDALVDTVTPERQLHAKQLCHAVARAVDRLPPQQAEALMLSQVAGVESAKICERLGVSRANFWVLVHRAKSAIRGGLAREGLSLGAPG